MTTFAAFQRSVGLIVLGFLTTTSGSAFAGGSTPHVLALDDVRDCALGPDGQVLGATAGGLVIARPGGRARVLTALDGLGETAVERVHVDGPVAHVEGRTTRTDVELDTGNVLGVSAMPERAFIASEPASLRKLPSGAQIRSQVEQRGSRCWATDTGLYVGGANSAPARLIEASLPTGDIAALAAGAGRLFIGTFDQGLFLRDPEGHVSPMADPAVHAHINALAWDEAREVLWIGTARGVARCSLVAEPRCQRVGGAGPIHTLLELEDGEVVAGGDGGLTFLRATGEVRGAFSSKQGAPFSAVWALAAKSDTLYVGTTRGLFIGPLVAFRDKAAGGRPERIRRASAITGELTEDWVTALAVDEDQLIVGLYHSGIVSLTATGAPLRRLRSDPSLGYVNPAGIVSLGAGRLAIATMDGLLVGKLGALRRVPTLAKDVTGVVMQGETVYVATRRGVQAWTGDSGR